MTDIAKTISDKQTMMRAVLADLEKKSIEAHESAALLLCEIERCKTIALVVMETLTGLKLYLDATEGLDTDERVQWLQENGRPGVKPRCLLCAAVMDDIPLVDEDGNVIEELVVNLEDRLLTVYQNVAICPQCEGQKDFDNGNLQN